MFKNFLFGVAKLSGTYTPKSRHQHAIDEIRAAVGDKEILVLVSGGVDSSVCAALCRSVLIKTEQKVTLSLGNHCASIGQHAVEYAREAMQIWKELHILVLMFCAMDSSAKRFLRRILKFHILVLIFCAMDSSV